MILQTQTQLRNQQLTLPILSFHSPNQKDNTKQKQPNSISMHRKSEVGFLLLVFNSRKQKLFMAIDPRKTSSPLILTSVASGRINALFSSLITALLAWLTVIFRGRKRGNSIPIPCSSSVEKVRVPAKKQTVDEEVEERRAIATRRVREGNDGNSERGFSLYVTVRGDTLFTQSWCHVSIKTRGLVVLLHGLNEHSGRYNDFAKKLNANGYKVYGMDWIGHGGSDGLHAYVHCLDYAVIDMKTFLHNVLAENLGLPCFCFGHSTGAAIVLKAVLDPEVEARVTGIVLTSPAVGVQPSHPILPVLAPYVSFLLPKYQLGSVIKKGVLVTRDPEALLAKYSDPLVYTGSIRARTGYEILRITSYLQQNLKSLRVPFLVLHGTSDTVTDPQASQKLYEEATSTDKSIKFYDGFLHDLLIEPERDAIMNDIIEWLNCRVKAR